MIKIRMSLWFSTRLWNPCREIEESMQNVQHLAAGPQELQEVKCVQTVELFVLPMTTDSTEMAHGLHTNRKADRRGNVVVPKDVLVVISARHGILSCGRAKQTWPLVSHISIASLLS